MKKLFEKSADFIKNNPYFVVLSAIFAICWGILPTNVAEGYKSNAFSFLVSLPKYLPPMTVFSIALLIIAIYVYFLQRTSLKIEKKLSDKDKETKALQERTEALEKALQERTEALEKALQERTEALELELYDLALHTKWLEDYVYFQVKDDKQPLKNRGLDEEQLKYLYFQRFHSKDQPKSWEEFLRSADLEWYHLNRPAALKGLNDRFKKLKERINQEHKVL